jgi:hypothetical protein
MMITAVSFVAKQQKSSPITCSSNAPLVLPAGHISPSTGTTLYFFDTIAKAKADCQHDFFVIFAIAAWEIWRQRNDKIFRLVAPSLILERSLS